MGEGTVKSGSTIYPRLCSGPRSQIISSFICRLLGFQTRASRGCSPQFFKKGNFDQNYQKILEKHKCRGPVSTFLAIVDGGGSHFDFFVPTPDIFRHSATPKFFQKTIPQKKFSKKIFFCSKNSPVFSQKKKKKKKKKK